MTYAPAENIFADADAKIALAKKLAERFAPLEGTPAELYLVNMRKLPAETVRACTEMRYLPSRSTADRRRTTRWSVCCAIPSPAR
jgi:hypothetical protein